MDKQIFEIDLGNGFVGIVDAEDRELASSYAWKVWIRDGGIRLYVRCKSDGETLLLHRVITSAACGQMVDHINHNGLDNRRENLRLCNNTQNQRNQRIKRVNERRNRKNVGEIQSVFKGVSWRKDMRCWKSQITVDGHRRTIGTFREELVAADAYDFAAIHFHQDFASLNTIPATSEAIQLPDRYVNLAAAVYGLTKNGLRGLRGKGDGG